MSFTIDRSGRLALPEPLARGYAPGPLALVSHSSQHLLLTPVSGPGQVLMAGWQSPYMPEFVSSLPIAAMDGTLRRRFNGAALEGQMHLKTGLLRDVRSVAGYVRDRAGRRMAVVCLHNHARADSAAGEAVQEALLQWVYERP